MTDKERTEGQAKADNDNQGRKSNLKDSILPEFAIFRGTIKTADDIPITELYRAVRYLAMDDDVTDRAASFLDFLRILIGCGEEMRDIVLEIALNFAFMQTTEHDATLHDYLNRFLALESLK